MSAPESLLPPGQHGAPGVPGVTLAERCVALNQVAVRRGAALRLPAAGVSAAMWGGVALGLGPGVAMLVGGERPELASDVAAVVEQSGGFVVLRIGGAAAAEALARGCRLDLHDAAFPAGCVARTLIAQVPVILWRPSGAPGYEMLVPTTLSRSFVRFLLHAGESFGCVVLPIERDS